MVNYLFNQNKLKKRTCFVFFEFLEFQMKYSTNRLEEKTNSEHILFFLVLFIFHKYWLSRWKYVLLIFNLNRLFKKKKTTFFMRTCDVFKQRVRRRNETNYKNLCVYFQALFFVPTIRRLWIQQKYSFLKTRDYMLNLSTVYVIWN